MLHPQSKGAAVPKVQESLDLTLITPSATITAKAHGWRAKCLQRLVRLDLPVPVTVALPAATVRAIAGGQTVDGATILSHFGAAPLVSVRCSPENPDWGGPATILNLGRNAARHQGLVTVHWQDAADALADMKSTGTGHALDDVRSYFSQLKEHRQGHSAEPAPLQAKKMG